MSQSNPENDLLEMDDFAQNACPTKRGIAESLAILRKHPRPFSAEALESRLDLLLLPFLRGVPTSDERVAHLQTALTQAADELSREHQLVYRYVFLDPAHERIGERRTAVFKVLPKAVGFRTRESPATVSRMEDRMLPILAEILLNPEFAEGLDIPRPEPHGAGRQPSYEADKAYEIIYSRAAIEIDDKDPRRHTSRRTMGVRMLVPDQRVVGIRFAKPSSDPEDGEHGVTLTDPSHTYLGTFPDTPPEGTRNWFIHLIDLGERKRPKDMVEVEISVQHFDETGIEPDLYLVFENHYDTLREVELAIRVPSNKIAEAKPETRISEVSGIVILKEPAEIEPDRWVRAHFGDLKVGRQYGIFFPGLSLYS
jgi:hypothetical protein